MAGFMIIHPQTDNRIAVEPSIKNFVIVSNTFAIQFCLLLLRDLLSEIPLLPTKKQNTKRYPSMITQVSCCYDRRSLFCSCCFLLLLLLLYLRQVNVCCLTEAVIEIKRTSVHFWIALRASWCWPDLKWCHAPLPGLLLCSDRSNQSL